MIKSMDMECLKKINNIISLLRFQWPDGRKYEGFWSFGK